MLTYNIQLFFIVEDEGFCAFLKHLAPHYKPPHRTTFSQQIIPDLYEKYKNDILNLIESAEYISFTSDIWSANNNAAFMSLTAHWIDDDFTQRQAVLRVIPIPERHTGVHMGKLITTALEDFNISKSKVHCVVTVSNVSFMEFKE